AVKPSNDRVAIVGTCVFDPNGNNGLSKVGNGAWYTSDASVATVIWSQSSFFDYNNQPISPPTSMVRIRYSSDSARVYLITPSALFLSTDDGHNFYQQGTSCIPAGSDAFTDLVVDPN